MAVQTCSCRCFNLNFGMDRTKTREVDPNKIKSKAAYYGLDNAIRECNKISEKYGRQHFLYHCREFDTQPIVQEDGSITYTDPPYHLSSSIGNQSVYPINFQDYRRIGGYNKHGQFKPADWWQRWSDRAEEKMALNRVQPANIEYRKSCHKALEFKYKHIHFQ